MRGKGYEKVLLVRGTATLLKSGAPLVRGDTDGDNRPMAKVFRNVGYRQFATRREFKVSLRWEQTWDQVLTPLAPGEIEVWPEDPLDLLARVVALHAMRLLIQRYEDPAGFEEDKKLAPAEWSFCSAKDLDEDEPAD
jgi:hypothetical protein